MSRYIDAEALLNSLPDDLPYKASVKRVLIQAPTADVVEERKMIIYERAIEAYGKDMQLTVAVEELSELIKEICKNKRGVDNTDHITEEVADCYIMLKQIAIIFGIKHCDISAVVDEKLARLERRLKERIENGT